MNLNPENDKRFTVIVREAYTAFTELGIRRVTMDVICQRLGISKKTLYRYVDNKADLLRKVFGFVRRQVEERMEELRKMPGNAIDILLEMSKIASRQHEGISPLVTEELKSLYPEIFTGYLRSKRELIVAYIEDNIRQGIKEGLFRHDLNIGIVANLYFRKVEDLHEPGMKDRMSFKHDLVFRVMFENHIRGISNQRGIEYFEKKAKNLDFNL
ncbi:MAG: TetR/AcrR family transcriptional regulator [Bacteroidales bacterium]|nr:TetR/AcrR family transcriptional regulator [Bacteroidales bacterium]